jgi:lysine 2-monooxygenase
MSLEEILCVLMLLIPLIYLAFAVQGKVCYRSAYAVLIIAIVVIVAINIIAPAMDKKGKAGAAAGQGVYDLIVVGGGISGLHTVYRLLKLYPGMKILVLEKGDVFGGRIKREYMGGNKFPVDMGAVRVPETFGTTLDLIKELDLPLTPFDPAFQGGWSKGKWYPKEDWAKSSKPYTGRESELAPDQLVFTTLRDMIGEEGFQDPTKIDPDMTIEGQRLVDYSINSLLALKLTRQQLDWVSNFWGFGWYKSDVNAYSWLVHNLTAPIDTSDPQEYTTKYFMIGPGFGNMFKLIEALDKKTQSATKILNFNVTQAKRHQQLWCVKGERTQDGKPLEFYGSNLLIATPTGALTMIDVDVPKGGRELWTNISQESTTPYILRRIYLRYPRKWWQDEEDTGAVYDDETNQMVWVLSKDAPVIMASYADQERASYSEGMTEEQLIDTYHQGVCRAFGVDCNSIPKPVEYKVKRWAYPEFAVWWTKVGVNQDELLQTSSQPFEGYPLFLASDALSTKSGWIDGALESSNLVVKRMQESLM